MFKKVESIPHHIYSNASKQSVAYLLFNPAVFFIQFLNAPLSRPNLKYCWCILLAWKNNMHGYWKSSKVQRLEHLTRKRTESIPTSFKRCPPTGPTPGKDVTDLLPLAFEVKSLNFWVLFKLPLLLPCNQWSVSYKIMYLLCIIIHLWHVSLLGKYSTEVPTSTSYYYYLHLNMNRIDIHMNHFF